jgi:hypothetical protein
MSGQLHAPLTLPPGERAPGTHWIGGRLGPRAGLDMVSKRRILSLRRDLNSDRLARSQPLCRLSYPGFSVETWCPINSMEQRPSWEIDGRSASQGIPLVLCNPKFRHHIHKSPPLVPSWIQSTPSYPIYKTYFNIILQSTARFPKWFRLFKFSY